MLRLVSVSALCLGLLAGCATTKNLVNKVSSSDTPLAKVLKERPDLVKELSTVEIRQFFNSVEAPTAAQVKVTETGLMDDSVRSIRTIYSFKHMDNDWKLIVACASPALAESEVGAAGAEVSAVLKVTPVFVIV